MERAIEAGADDVTSDEDEHTVLTSPADLTHVAAKLRLTGLSITSEKFVSLPQTTTTLTDLALARQILKLNDQLDDYPDTVNVFTNFEISDEIADALGD
jgi:transcriptional/translational regulatory protein YebC/TACO1